ncbi:VanZ family protein [Paenibacillus thailandensis]|uniref:VanZ family protein n=1 Tax=Paenibacillus thailandensis TaxID=393250 RepID=A0ABW5QX39_9BACL
MIGKETLFKSRFCLKEDYMNQTDTAAGRAPRVRLALRWAPAVIWMAVIFAMSSRSGDDMNSLLPFFQKWFPAMSDFNWGHFVAYFVLAAAFDFGIGPKASKLGMKLLIVVLCGLYGVTDEYHQSFVGGRMSDWHDIRNDMIGATVWVVIAAIPPFAALWRKLGMLAATGRPNSR